MCWEDLELERVTEMVARKRVRTPGFLLTQVYLKQGSLVARHTHHAEQILYVLQGRLRVALGAGDDRTPAGNRIVCEGEVLSIPPGLAHQAEALDDTFVLSVDAADVVGPA